ncbi:MlaA family lipoprotein [Hydrogenophaga soli]|nr:VacJ family lipoprotein [Burkholderiaceae bacterium]
MSATLFPAGPRRSALTRWAGVLLLVLSAVLAGCASGPARDPRDPLEPFNRSMYDLNTKVDEAVVKPVAIVYRDVTPYPVRTAVGNFFGNLSDIWSTLNTALQLRGEDTIINAMRVGFNTFFGFGGLVDVASEMNLYRSPADFGQTLGRWGVPPGPYMVLPVLGPSTLRDTLGRGVETRGDRVWGVDHIPSRNSLLGLRLLEERTNLLRASSVLDEAALDKYSFTREVFLQRRQSIIDSQRNREAE